MLGNLQGWHLVVILAVVLLLFGAPKLPGLARSIGQSMRIFRSEVKTMKDENGNVVVVEEDAEDEAPTAKTSTAKSTAAKAAPKGSTSKPKS
ncbi:MAG: Sec-independent protein translocase subunit TatA [Rhodoglobus sp.]|nr:Sec-independent protein translocase subunit TatA [Rhodoglobus sp.]